MTNTLDVNKIYRLSLLSDLAYGLLRITTDYGDSAFYQKGQSKLIWALFEGRLSPRLEIE